MKKTVWLVIAGLFLIAQFVQPNRNVPRIDPAQDIRQSLGMPADVQSVLVSACYDCHSYETKYPWYSKVAPASWWISQHIQEGRKELNFSTFGALSPEEQGDALEDAAEAVQKGEMPLNSYVWLHPAANLSGAQRDILVRYFQQNSAGAEAETTPGLNDNATPAPKKTYREDDD